MNMIGVVVITVMMACAVAGALASLLNSEEGLGKEFLDGLHSIGYIFVPVAGIMASVPYLSELILQVFGPGFAAIGADPAIAATTLIAVDMGGYQLADVLAGTHRENWIMAMIVGYMAGATIVFSIPVGLNLLHKRDHQYLALGVMSGLLSIPVGVLVSCLLLMLLEPEVRTVVSTSAPADLVLQLPLRTVLFNLAPLAAFMVLLAVGLRLIPDQMIRGFMVFGRGMNVLITLVLAASIVQYFTQIFYGEGLFTLLFGHWGFDPIIADKADPVRALEVAGYIGIMLSGAFPMVYLMRKYLARPMELIGRKLGMEAAGAAGMLAAVANILAMFRLVGDMPAKDKVRCIAFAVCAAFLFGDHLAFTANFQPNLLLPVMAGKLSGGIFAFVLANRLSVPKAVELEQQTLLDEVRGIADRIPALTGQSFEVVPLTGGLTNRNYVLKTAQESYVLRIAGADTELLGIDREREVACSHAAAGAGVGPAVIAHLPDQQTLVTSFITGRFPTPDDLLQPEFMRRMAEALHRFHDSPAPPGLGSFSPFETVRSYTALARQKHVPLPPELEEATGLLNRIERELATAEPPRLCHNDLLIGNILDDGSALWIIDWEYGGLGDRFFDLGNFAVNTQLNEEQERALLTCYFGECRPDHLRRLKLMRLASDMREATWGYLQAGTSKLHPPAYYLNYGRKHLMRFLEEARGLNLPPHTLIESSPKGEA